MESTLGRQTDTVRFLEALSEAPYRYDFYQTLRRFECAYAEKPRWGCAFKPVDEPVRLGQDPDLSFAPAPLASFEIGRAGAPSRLHVRLFGLLGPNGPLPLHLTERARHRLYHLSDPTLSRFLDLFNHRFLALFYRAWAQAQPHVNRDRPRQDRFSVYIGAFVGTSPAAFRDRDTVPDLAKFFHVGALIRQVRNAEGLAAVLRHFFRVPVRIEEFVGGWMVLGRRERSYLGRDNATLGVETVAGGRVWDHQHKFRIHLGPLTLSQYEGFLPAAPKRWGSEGGPASSKRPGSTGGHQGVLLRKLVDWVRLYLCFELDWDVRLTLERAEVPRLELGGRSQLGWTTWLGTRQTRTDADDLCVNAELVVDRDVDRDPVAA